MIAKAAWGNDDEVKVETCIPLLRNGKPHWWLEGPAANRDESGYVATGYALLDERRAVVWKDRESSDSFGYQYHETDATDLDGDGNDEVLYGRRTGEGGMSRTELVIVHFAPAPTINSIILGMSGMDGGCDGSWSVVPSGRGKIIDVTREGSSCDAKELHERYDAQGKALAP